MCVCNHVVKTTECLLGTNKQITLLPFEVGTFIVPVLHMMDALRSREITIQDYLTIKQQDHNMDSGSLTLATALPVKRLLEIIPLIS